MKHTLFKEFKNGCFSLKNGCFSLKSTSKPFSGIPIDLTLEQTVNADVACQRRGIIALTNSISARQRWAQNHSLRTTIISTVFEELNLSKKEDVSEDIKPHRIKQNCKASEKLMHAITATMNPFSAMVDKENLFSISTGKAASQETTDFLLNAGHIGSSVRDAFVQNCCNDPSRYSKPIK